MPYCPKHNIPITGQTLQEMTQTVMDMPERSRLTMLAPIVKNRKGTFSLKISGQSWALSYNTERLRIKYPEVGKQTPEASVRLTKTGGAFWLLYRIDRSNEKKYH